MVNHLFGGWLWLSNRFRNVFVDLGTRLISDFLARLPVQNLCDFSDRVFY